MVFEVYVDGALRAASGPVSAADGPRTMVVEGLETAQELRLITRLAETTKVTFFGYREILWPLGSWGDPRFYQP